MNKQTGVNDKDEATNDSQAQSQTRKNLER